MASYFTCPSCGHYISYINIPNQINNQNINDNQNININENIKYTSFYEGMTETLRRVFLNIYNNQVSKETFTKNNGLFYLGMFIIFIAIIVFILSQIN